MLTAGSGPCLLILDIPELPDYAPTLLDIL